MKKYLKATLICVSITLVSSQYLFSQQKTLIQQVEETMELRRQQNYWKGISPFRAYIRDSAQAMLDAFKPYVADSLENVRSLAYTAIAVSGQKSDDLSVRQQAVAILTDGCLDKEPSLRKNIAGQLENFLKDDFTQDSKQKLADLFYKEPTYFTNTVKLVGFLDMTDQTNTLKGLLNSEQVKSRTLKWDIHLTLARLRDEEEISYCVDFIRGTGLNDKVIYNLFPDLVYIRSAIATDFMIEVLNRDSKDCFSPNPDNPVKISCAYRVMEFLAPIIKDFPLATDDYGDLDIDNYEEALRICRRWFRQNTDYEINRDRF